MSMRLRGASVADLEELGIDTEGMSQGKKSVVQQFKAQAGIDIMEGTNYKTTFQVLDELHDKWADLNDAERAAITEAVGGKRGGSVMSSLMTNWEDAQKVVQTAENSFGSAEKEMSHKMESIDYSIQRVKASAEELAHDALDAKFTKGVIELINSVLQGLDSIIEDLGTFPVLIGAIGTAFSAANLDKIVGFFSGVTARGQQVSTIQGAISSLGSGNAYKIAENLLGKDNIKNMATADILNVIKKNGGTEELARNVLIWRNISGAEADAALEAAHFIEQSGKAGNSGQKVSELKAAWLGLADSIGVSTTALGAFVGVAAGIAVVAGAIIEAHRAMAAIRESSQQFAENFSNTKTELEGYKEEVISLNEKLADSNTTYEESKAARERLYEIQSALIENYGSEKDAIDMITKAIDGEVSALDRLSNKEWQKQLNEFDNQNIEGRADWLAMLFGGVSSKKDLMLKEIEGVNGEGITKTFNIAAQDVDFFEKISNKYGDALEKIGEGTDGVTYQLKGNAFDILDILYEIQSQSESYSDATTKMVNSRVKDIEKTVKPWEDFYQQYALQEYIFKNGKLTDLYKRYNQEVADYQSSLSTGDEKQIELAKSTAKNTFAAIKTEIEKSGLTEAAQKSVLDAFEGVAPELQNYFNQIDFEEALNNGKIKDTLANIVKNFQYEEDIRFYNEEGASKGQIDAYNQLTILQDKYNVGLEYLISLLKERNGLLSKSDEEFAAKTKHNMEELAVVSGKSRVEIEKLFNSYSTQDWINVSKHLDEFKEALGFIKAEANQIPISFEDAKASVLEFINGTDDTTSELEDLQNALADTRNMSVETYEALISHSQKYANTISIENGRLVVNRDRLNAVASSRVKEQKEILKQASNLKKLEYLKHFRELKMYDDKLVDTTSDTYNNALALQDQITQLDLLSNQLDIASDSFERFKEAQSTENAPDYETGMSAFSAITEGLESGKVGTDDFKYAMQALMSVDQYKEFVALAKEGYDAQYDFMEKWQKQNAKFFTEDDRANAIAWQEYLIETGLLQDGMIASSEELGKATGFSYDTVNALNENLNQFDFDGKIISQYQIDYIDEANEALTNLTNAQQAYNEAVESGADENLITGLKEDLEKAQVDYDEFIQGIPDKVKEAKEQISEDDINLLDALFGENETDATAFTEVLGMQIDTLTQKAKEFEATNQEGVLNSDAYKKVIEDLKTYQSIYNEIVHANYQRVMANTSDEDMAKQARMVDNIRQQQERLKTLRQGLSEVTKQGNEEAITRYKDQIAAVQYSLSQLSENQIFIDIQIRKDAIDSEINALRNELEELQKSAPIIDLSGGKAGAYQAQQAMQNEIGKKKSAIDKLEKQKMELETTITYVTDADEAEKKRKELEQDIDTDVNINIKDEDMQKTKLLHDLLDDIKNMGNIQVGVDINASGSTSLLQNGAKIGYIPNGAPSGIGGVYGTAHVDGNWGLPKDEKGALVGEIAPEGLVRDGKFYLIGKHGAERRNLKKGDVIFNGAQTAEILKNGYSAERGTLVGGGHVLGTVLGSAFVNANNKMDEIKIRGGSSFIQKAIKNAGDTAKEEIDETEKETEEATDNFIDWIERRINHVTTIAERKLKSTEKLLDRVTNTLYSGGKNGVKAYKTFDKTVNSFYKSATKSQKAVMEVQSQAYEAYENLSNAVGLDAEYQKRVKEGIMEIENVTDEALSKQIQQYQDYYDKSQTALDAFIDAADKFYHMPIDKAAEKIENLNNKLEYLGNVSSNAIGFREQNAIIDEQARQQKEIKKASRQAKNKTEKNRDKAAKSLNSIVLKETKADLKSTQKKLKQEKKDVKAKKTLATASKKAQNEIKKATKANEKIDTKQLKKGTKAYKEAVQYNKALKANDVAKTSNKTVKRAVRDKQAINPDDVPNASKKATQSIYAYNSAVASATEAWNEFKNKKEEVDHLLNVEYPKQAFDNVINSWEHVISVYDSDITDLQNQINQLTTLGKKVGTGFYKAQKEIDQNKLAGLKQDRIDAEKAFAELDKNGRYSDEWVEARDALKQIDTQISELTIDIYNMNKEIVQAHSDAVKAMNEDIDWLSSEVDLFKELQSFYENTDEKTGWYTSQGLNNMALLKAQRDMRSEQLKNTQTYYKTLKDMMDKGILDNGELVFNSFEELTAAAEEAQKEQANYVKEVNASDDALAKAVIEQLQAELKFMQNISDEKKKALQSEKDLYEYQKKILDKTKNIAKLERQIAAYSGDSSEEGRAKRQRLQGQLNEAQEDLRDTEYDRYISDQTQMLDDMMKEYGDRVEELSKNRDWLLEQANNIATASKDIALQSLTQLANANGYIPIEMQNLSDAVLQNGTNTTTAISGYLGEGSPLYSMIQANNAAEVTSSSDALNSIKNILGQSGTTSIQDYLKIISENTAPTEIAQEMIETTAVPAMEVASDILSLGGLLDVSGSSGKKSSTKKSSSKKSSTKKSTTKTTTTKKTTTKKKKKNGAADGGIVEALNRMVFDNGDDGIATVRVGEAILTPTDSKNLASLADKFQTIDVSADILNALKSPDNRSFGTSAQNIDYGGVQFNFELPNVVDSSTFIRAIQNDSKLQKAIQSVSVDRLNGGGRLSVRNIK